MRFVLIKSPNHSDSLFRQSTDGPITQDNQTMKFGQLKEYQMRNIFLEKSYTVYGGETIPRPFSKKIKTEDNSGSIV